MPTGVQHRGQQAGQAVEEDLRQQQVAERGDQVLVDRLRGTGHQDGQDRGAGHREHGGHRQEDGGGGQQTLGVRLAAVGLLPPGADQQRDDHTREYPAEQQLVHHVGQGVGEVVVVPDELGADRGGDGRGPDEAGDPADDAPGGHHRAVAGHRAGALVQLLAGRRSGRTGRATAAGRHDREQLGRRVDDAGQGRAGGALQGGQHDGGVGRNHGQHDGGVRIVPSITGPTHAQTLSRSTAAGDRAVCRRAAGAGGGPAEPAWTSRPGSGWPSRPGSGWPSRPGSRAEPGGFGGRGGGWVRPVGRRPRARQAR